MPQTIVFYELKKKNPDKMFYPAGGHMICEDMKKITVDKVLKALQDTAAFVIITICLSSGKCSAANNPATPVPTIIISYCFFILSPLNTHTLPITKSSLSVRKRVFFTN